MKQSYFRQLPLLDYPSLANDRTSTFDYAKVKNIFKRSVLRDDLFNDFVTFTEYSIQGDERPDAVAEKFYNDPQLDWVILITNNILSIRDEWPMSEPDLFNYMNEKYTAQELSYVHHYETLKVLNGQNQLIQPEGLWVDSDHTVSWLEDGILRTESRIKLVSYQQYEIDKNDAKRNINILKKEYLSIFMQDNSEIMEYHKSQQYINKSLKKTENPRLINPR